MGIIEKKSDEEIFGAVKERLLHPSGKLVRLQFQTASADCGYFELSFVRQVVEEMEKKVAMAGAGLCDLSSGDKLLMHLLVDSAGIKTK